MKYFNGVTTLDELKAAYRRLAKKLHPDHGGSTEAMQALNAEYESLFQILKDKHNATADEYHQTTEAPHEFIDIINALLKLDGLEVELCGSWLWIGGETLKHREALKAAGCRWSKNKAKWYWRHPEDARPHKGHSKSMDYIRVKYGSQFFTADGREDIRLAGATA